MFDSYFFDISEEEGKKMASSYQNPEISCPFTNRERDVLKELLNKSIKEKSFNSKVWGVFFSDEFSSILRIEGKSDLVVWKLDDDWFIVKMKYYNGNSNKYYRCDQFEGLLKLLQYLEFIS